MTEIKKDLRVFNPDRDKAKPAPEVHVAKATVKPAKKLTPVKRKAKKNG